MRLPELEIPKFRGNTKKWPEIRDSYEGAIDKSNLLDVEKFNYLKTLVIGEVAYAISDAKLPLEIKLLIAKHIKDIWNLTKILELLNEELKAYGG